MRSIVRSAGVILFFLILSVVSSVVSAADYPTKPITLLVPTAPGGKGDLLARAFASVSEKYLGKTIVVVNQAGASGQKAMFALSQAAPDGHTLSMVSTFEYCAAEWEIANGRQPLANMADFVSLGVFGESPYVITVPYDSPWKNLRDLINDAKAKPGVHAMGLAGMYTAQHYGAESFARGAGIKFRQVPYSGAGDFATALVGNHVTWGVSAPSAVIPLMHGKKVRILGVLGDKRYGPIRDIPTVKESGVDAVIYSRVGLLAPPKTPMPIVRKIEEAMKKACQDEGFKSALSNAGEEASYISGEETAKLQERELVQVRKLWKQIVEENKGK
jgi:tripartite-type tricarboxylate transporter receptor subunit TctC